MVRGNIGRRRQVAVATLMLGVAATFIADPVLRAGALARSSRGAPTPIATRQARLGITTGPNTLLRDGRPWQPRGFTLVGELPPTGKPTDANLHYNQAELDVAMAWHADTLRFQVGQPGLDPQDSHHSAAYVQRVQDAVALARSNGFVVILSMQDQGLSQDPVRHPLPTPATSRAWDTLAPMFKNDPNVIYELFNEPVPLVTDADAWTWWRDGSSGQTVSVPNSRMDAVSEIVIGHQQLLTQIRNLGVPNLLLADGLDFAKSFSGLPAALSDPLGNVAYATHPYFLGNNSRLLWDEHFGIFAATHAVIATEWAATSQLGQCQSTDPTRSVTLLDYLKAHNIGITPWALDWPASLIRDWTYTPTDFNGYTCGVSGGGPGSLVKSTFTSWAGR